MNGLGFLAAEGVTSTDTMNMRYGRLDTPGLSLNYFLSQLLGRPRIGGNEWVVLHLRLVWSPYIG
jgi:hypothetical protein